MTKEIIRSSNAPVAIGPYSQAVSTGDFIFTSGQIPINPKTGSIPTTIKAQTKLVLKNLQALLEDAGSSMSSIVKTTVFLKNMNDFHAANEVYASFFNGTPPARSCVEVSKLPKDVLIEIEAVALTK